MSKERAGAIRQGLIERELEGEWEGVCPVNATRRRG